MFAWQEYLQSIRACYARNPRAQPCYAQLERFLEGSYETRLQRIRCLDVRPSIDISQSIVAFDSSSRGPKICILEGFPCPFQLGTLCHEYQIQPEFPIRHLGLSDSKICRTFNFPALPSEQHNCFHVRLITLAATSGVQHPEPISQLRSLRLERQRADQALILAEENLFQVGKYGDSVIRKIHLHNKNFCSIEQLVSITITNDNCKDSIWTAVILTDSGRPLPDKMPWHDHTSGSTKDLTPAPKLSRKGFGPSGRSLVDNAPEKFGTQAPLHSYHPFQVLEMIDKDSLCADPFLLLCHLYKEASTSWAQLFNFLDQDISICQNCSIEESSTALEQLRFNMGLIERFRGFLVEDRETIRKRGSPDWIRSQYNSKETIPIDELQAALLGDYEYLLEKAVHMSKRCQGSSGILVSQIAVLESQKSIQQAARLGNLTRLAFWYIPASFVSSVFGMNVHEIASRLPSIWIFFVVAIPVTALSIAVASTQK